MSTKKTKFIVLRGNYETETNIEINKYLDLGYTLVRYEITSDVFVKAILTTVPNQVKL